MVILRGFPNASEKQKLVDMLHEFWSDVHMFRLKKQRGCKACPPEGYAG